MKHNIIVIGTVLIDCKGFAETRYIPEGKNIGSVRLIHGGVGRNVTENLSRIGLTAGMATTVNSDGTGRDVVEHLQNCGASTEHIVYMKERGMGLWMAILDETGRLIGSISDMPDLSGLEQLIDERGEAIISDSTHVVLVMDLNETLTRNIRKIAHKLNKPVYGLPSNFSVIQAHPDVLDGLECFICNELEAERLIGVSDLKGLEQGALECLLLDFAKKHAIRYMVVTLGEAGSVYCNTETGVSGFQPAERVKLVDSSGAGDAFFSGTVAGLLWGAPLSDAVRIGTRMAGWTIGQKESCCSDLGSLCRRDQLISAYL
ncbi:carbohydrate kinase family protein [Paenibacillus gansuensis]|uniref:Carbohydrate kinase family protein n=1 Tax=Paenibacillus gansuensis TaxID=306542 RepID=A0ABW5PIX3_9BACL